MQKDKKQRIRLGITFYLAGYGIESQYVLLAIYTSMAQTQSSWKESTIQRSPVGLFETPSCFDKIR